MAVNIFKSMLGLTMKSVEGKTGDDQMVFTANNGKQFKFLHHQDCCESVCIEDIYGDISDLVGSPIIQAEEVDNMDPPSTEYDSATWTFYRFATAKGFITVRWLGVSNGYYSETVSFEEE